MSDPTAMPLFPSAGATSTDENRLRQRVIEACRAENLPAVVDVDGDVMVSVHDQSLFVRCFDTRPELIRVFGSWRIDDMAGDELTHLRAANGVTGAINLIKTTVHADQLVVAADLLVGDQAGLRSLLTATFDAVFGAVQTWYGTVQELLAGA